jgi:hypothetical protein
VITKSKNQTGQSIVVAMSGNGNKMKNKSKWVKVRPKTKRVSKSKHEAVVKPVEPQIQHHFAPDPRICDDKPTFKESSNEPNASSIKTKDDSEVSDVVGSQLWLEWNVTCNKRKELDKGIDVKEENNNTDNHGNKLGGSVVVEHALRSRDLERQLKEERENTFRMQFALAATESELASCKESMVEKNSQYFSSQLTIVQLNEKITQMNEEKARWEQDTSSLWQEKNQMEQVTTSLRQEKAQMMERIAELEEKSEMLEAHNIALLETIAEKDRKQNEETKVVATDMHGELQQKVAIAEHRIQVFTNELLVCQQQNHSLRNTIQFLNNKMRHQNNNNNNNNNNTNNQNLSPKNRAILKPHRKPQMSSATSAIFTMPIGMSQYSGLSPHSNPFFPNTHSAPLVN